MGASYQPAPELTNAVAIAAGSEYSMALLADGTVVEWGGAPRSMPYDLTHVVDIAVGHEYSVALIGDGTAVIWWGGRWPTYAGTNGVAVTTAGDHVHMLQQNGTVVPLLSTPLMEPPPGLANVAQGSSGWAHCLALKDDGSLAVWGDQGFYDFGQFNIPGVCTNIVDIDAGPWHNLAHGNGTAPLLIGPPQDQSAAPGDMATFNAVARGALPMSYQWQFNGVDVPGATLPYFTRNPVNSYDEGHYRVIVCNKFGSVTSPEAMMTMLPREPAIVTEPADQDAWEGDSVTLEVVVQGTPTLHYQWQLDQVDLPDATNCFLNFPAVDPMQAGFYRVMISNGYGSVTSRVATLTVTAPEPTILQQPTNTTVVAGQEVVFCVEVAGKPPLHLQWQFDEIALWGGHGTCLSLADVQEEHSGCYRVVVTNEYGAITSQVASLTVTPSAPHIAQPPSSVTVPIGSPAAFGVSATGAPILGYQWRFNGANLAGANSQTLALPAVQLADAGAYSVRVTNGFGAVTSSEGSLRIVPVLAWGNNLGGQTNVPTTLNISVPQDRIVVAVAGGAFHSLALRPDGSLVAWGDNGFGQGTIPSGLPEVAAVAAGGNHNVALLSDGIVSAWGDNLWGQCEVPPGMTRVVAVAAGYDHSLALCGDGAVVAWGSDYNDSFLYAGQASIPVGLAHVVSIGAGSYHSLALEADGTVTAWGDNRWDQCEVPADLTSGTAVCGGYAHSLALRSDGTVRAWGNNQYGQTDVPPGLSNVVAIAAGFAQNLALRSDGTAEAWGALWDGTDFASPDLPTALSDVEAIACGSYHSLVLAGRGAPEIVLQPSNQEVLSGTAVDFRVRVYGAPQLQYQWQFEDVALPGQSQTWLVLDDARPTHAGRYRVSVSNAFGSTSSDEVTLEVLSLPLVLTDDHIVDPSTLTFDIRAADGHPIHPTFLGWVDIQAATDIGHWSSATNVHLTLTNGAIRVSDPDLNLRARRFYRSGVQ